MTKKKTSFDDLLPYDDSNPETARPLWVQRPYVKLQAGDMAAVKEPLLWAPVSELASNDLQEFRPIHEGLYAIYYPSSPRYRPRSASRTLHGGFVVVFLSSVEKISGALEIRILFDGKVYHTFALLTPEAYLVKIEPRINGLNQNENGL